MSIYGSKIPYEPTIPKMPKVEAPAKWPPLEWNVFIFRGKFLTYNIFEHYAFKDHVEKAAAECETKGEFAERLKSELRYYYWAKSEWEIVLVPWIGDGSKKVDVYTQVMANWDLFLNYTWNHMKYGII